VKAIQLRVLLDKDVAASERPAGDAANVFPLSLRLEKRSKNVHVCVRAHTRTQWDTHFSTHFSEKGPTSLFSRRRSKYAPLFLASSRRNARASHSSLMLQRRTRPAFLLSIYEKTRPLRPLVACARHTVLYGRILRE